LDGIPIAIFFFWFLFPACLSSVVTLLSAATGKTTAAARVLRKSQPNLQRSKGLATLAAVTNQTNRTLYSTFLLSLH